MAAKLNLDKLDLQIIQHMMENAEISYADLGKKLFVSGGTIHVRIKKLQEAGVVETKKGFAGNRPQTWCRLTATGRKRFTEYVAELEKVVSDALKRESPASAVRARLSTA